MANEQAKHALDSLAQTRIRVGGFCAPAFQVCGYTGVLAAILLSMTLVGKTGLSNWVMIAIACSAMATFLALVFATKIITGEEQIIYYHHEIAVMVVTALLVKVLHRPVLPYMDLTILGIGAFLACGRIGCLMVGCCHGRPCAWGIRYHDEHAREGFAPYLVGIRLFPIQAMESLWVLLVVIVGVRFVLSGSPPGSALAWYTIAYGSARFLFEFVRGDTDRPYTLGFSQGQWLSLWLMSALIWAESSGRIVFQRWHVIVVFAVPVTMLLVALQRKADAARTYQIVHPHHVSEIAGAMQNLYAIRKQELSPASAAISIACTSIGLQISAGKAGLEGTPITHVTISGRGRRITRKSAEVVANVIQKLGRVRAPRELISGEEGVFHMLLPGAQNGGLHE